jgi:broad specificity phosphatase PhoE
MIACNIRLDFKTAQPLSQETGMKMWENGTHFRAMSGKATYRLRADGCTAESLMDAVQAVTANVEDVVAEASPDWPNVVFVGIEAQAV